MSEAEELARTGLPIGQAPFEDEAPDDPTTKDKLVNFAREHPALIVVGGLAVGALAAALVRGRGSRAGSGESFARRAAALAAAASEFGLTLSRQARDSAGDATREGRHRLEEGSAVVRHKAGRLAHEARDTGRRIADEAKRLASRATH